MGILPIFASGGLTGGMLAAVLASGGGLLLLLIAFLVILSQRRRRQQRRDPFDLSLEDVPNDSLSVKSAPASRTPSPRQVKRLSCPDALAVPPATGDATVPGGLPQAGLVPDFSLPSERVQPRSEGRGAPLQGTGHAGTPHTTALELCQPRDNGSGQPHLYRRSSSLSENEDLILPRSTQGRLWYSLLYDSTLEVLKITLIRVKDIPGRGSHNYPRDPYVKVFVLPDDRTSRTSKVRKKTLSPVFNETFLFQVPAQELEERTLRFSVYDVDKRKVRHSLGHVMVPLADVDLDQEDITWADLEDNTQLSSSSLGEMQVGLCYQPQHEKLKVCVQRVRHLKNFPLDRQARLCVKLQLYYGRKLHRTKRTGCRQGRGLGEETGDNNDNGNDDDQEIEFGESLAFSVAGKQLDSCRLEAYLVQPRLTGADMDWGRVVLGPFMFARGEQLAHWQHMLAQPRVTVTRWHALSAPRSAAHD